MELDDAFLRELMEGDDDASLAQILLNDVHVRPSQATGQPSTSNPTDHKIQMLERQLEEQKMLLTSIMAEKKPTGRQAWKGTALNERRRINRAKNKREQDALEHELELKAHSLLAAHEIAQGQNQALKARISLLESSVRLREDTLSSLSLQRKGKASGLSTDLLNEVPIKHFGSLPDPTEGWDAGTCQRVQQRMTGSAYRDCWKSFVSEAALLATAIEAHHHPPDQLNSSDPLQARLALIVSQALSVTDQVCSLNPAAYYSSLNVNLMDGTVVSEKPGKAFWLQCLQRISLDQSQIKLFVLAMEEHQRRVAGLLNERGSLAADLTQLNLDLEKAEKLSDNVKKEAASTGLTIDLLTLKVLSPFQIARLCSAAYPLMPDPTEIASVAMEMVQVGTKR